MSDRRAVFAVVKAVLLALVVLFLAATVRDAVIELRDSSRSVSWAALAAVPVLGGSLLLYAYAWARALEAHFNLPLVRAVVASQLTRYVPGAVWQPVTQVLWTTTADGTRKRGATTYVVFMLGLLASAFVVGGSLTLSEALGWPLRLVAACGVLGLLFLAERPLAVLSERIVRFLPRLGVVDLPSGRTRVELFAMGLALHVAQGLAFWICLASIGAHVSIPSAIAGFAAAWAVGILVVPLPAGLGMRELALGAVLASALPFSLVVLGSLVMRLAGVAAEVLVFGLSVLGQGRRQGMPRGL